jgi:small subunit ribosomal protein S13
MITFLGRHITETVKLGSFLTSVYGLGFSSSVKICKFIGLSYSAKIYDVESEKLSYLQHYLNSYLLESDLRRHINENIQFKLKIQSYQGLRLSQGLPARGQRTKTNSRTTKKFRYSKN